MMDLIVPIVAAFALTFVVAGALCLTGAYAETALPEPREPTERAPRRDHQRTDQPSSTM